MRWSTTGGHINLFRKRAQPWHTIGDRTEWQAIADEIKPALAFARAYLVKVNEDACGSSITSWPDHLSSGNQKRFWRDPERGKWPL
jgi:hypothetical protein